MFLLANSVVNVFQEVLMTESFDRIFLSFMKFFCDKLSIFLAGLP